MPKPARLPTPADTETWGAPCPIPGCGHVYAKARRIGVFWHVGKVSNHPTWLPTVSDPKKRAEAFYKEYAWFIDAPTSYWDPATGGTAAVSGVRSSPVTSPAPPSIRVVPPPPVIRSDAMRCPLRGCEHVYSDGIEGWEAHVGDMSLHPSYLPEFDSPKVRQKVFRLDFPGWFDQASEE